MNATHLITLYSIALVIVDAAMGGWVRRRLAKAVISHFDKRRSYQEAQFGIVAELSGASEERRQALDLGDRRIDARSFMIRSHLAQVTRPIVFVGDSITEGALCHPRLADCLLLMPASEAPALPPTPTSPEISSSR